MWYFMLDDCEWQIVKEAERNGSDFEVAQFFPRDSEK